MGIKEVLSEVFKRDEDLKEMQKQVRLQKMVEDRMKSADERELERFHNEEREKQIKEELAFFRKKRNADYNSTRILNNDHNVMKQDFDILKDKPLFSGKANNVKGGNMFWN